MLDFLALTRRTLQSAGIAHRRSSVIALNRSTRDRPAFAAIVFTGDESAPSVFMKSTAEPAAATALRREFENLEALHRGGSSLLRATVPAPLHLGTIDGQTVLVESMLPGRRMKNLPARAYFASRAFERHLDAILAWLGALHRCADLGAEAVEHEPAAVLRRYRDAFDRSPALDRLLDESAAHLEGADLPRSPWHGDFCTANILVRDDGGVGVIDWEHPLVRTWPLLDLVYCVSSFRVARRERGPAAHAENFRRLHFAHPLRARLRERVFAHAAGLGVPAGDVLPLSVLAWASYASLKHAAQGGHRPRDGAEQWPLIIFGDRRCLNLEMIAADRASYLWTAPPARARGRQPKSGGPCAAT